MNDSSQAFTHYVINRINPEIRKSLTQVQLQGIRDAVAANSPYSRHSVDIRGVLPFFFARFYFVVLMGRDKRNPTRRREFIRRKESDVVANIVFYFFMMAPVVLFLLSVWYVTKSELGIDLFQDAHLIDWFK